MKTKKYKLKNLMRSIISVIMITLYSCGDYFDVTDNPSLVSDPNINGMVSTATFRAAHNSYNIAYITSHYSQYVASATAGSSSDTYEETNNYAVWDAMFFAMSDLYDLITKADEQQAHHHKAIGQTLLAYQLGLVADTWGNAPYTEAFGKVNTLQPKYDDEETLYNEQNLLLDEAIDNFKKENSFPFSTTADLIHGQDIDKWLKTAYALKARVLNKISKKSTYNPKDVLAALDKSYTSNNDNAGMSTFKGINQWAAVARDNENLILHGWLSSNFIDHLNGTKYGVEDPRIKFITEKTIDGNIYIGTRNGEGNIGSNTARDECYISRKSPLTSDDSPIIIVSYAETKMIEAEAALRTNDKARAYKAYTDGIKAHFELLGVSNDETEEYLNRENVAVGENALSLAEIFKEKYVITYLNAEAWNDLRRYDYQHKDFLMPVNAKLDDFIRRVAHPSTERAKNGDNVPPAVPLDTHLWWDKN